MRRAIICDIDNTICAQLEQPIAAACRALLALAPSIEVHYVTGRPQELLPETERFLQEHRLPYPGNLYLRPSGTWKSAREYKTEVMQRLASQYFIVASIGDSDEDEQASTAAGIPFVRVCEEAWGELARLVAMAQGTVEPDRESDP